MRKYAIGDVDIFISDGNYSSKYPRSEEFVPMGIPFIRANNLFNNTIIDDDMYYITKEKHELLQKGHLKENDVLITTRGNIGQVALVPQKYDDANINAQIVLLRPNSLNIYNRYLLHVLQSNDVVKQINESTTGTALKQLPVNRLKKIKIPIPSLDLQIYIANLLDNVSNLIIMRKEQLNKMDMFVKARFVELFSGLDCRISTFGKEFAFVSRGKSPVYVECSNLAVINQACIYWESINYNRVKYNESSYCGDRVLQHGDVLINSTGTGTLGRANIFINTDISCRFMADSHVTIMRGSSTCNPIYIKCFLEQTRTQEDIYRLCVSGSTNQIELSKEKFRQLKLPVPPMELQEEFATFVEQTDKSKLEVQKSLEKLELLKKALMQKYFG